MKRAFLPLALAVLSLVPASSAELPSQGTFQGNYSYYRNQVAISFEGDFARKLFDALGPKAEDNPSCGYGKLPYRQRTSGDMSCTLRETGEYRCAFGFDLARGKPVRGTVC